MRIQERLQGTGWQSDLYKGTYMVVMRISLKIQALDAGKRVSPPLRSCYEETLNDASLKLLEPLPRDTRNKLLAK